MLTYPGCRQSADCFFFFMHQSIETTAPRPLGHRGECNICTVLHFTLFPVLQGKLGCYNTHPMPPVSGWLEDFPKLVSIWPPTQMVFGLVRAQRRSAQEASFHNKQWLRIAERCDSCRKVFISLWLLVESLAVRGISKAASGKIKTNFGVLDFTNFSYYSLIPKNLHNLDQQVLIAY